MTAKQKRGVVCAILAAAFYALNSPLSKLLLGQIGPTMMAAFLYIGAGLGMSVVQLLGHKHGLAQAEQRLTRKELPYTLGMVVLDIAAPIALMLGLARTSAANAALLNNFEIEATSLIALCIFKERISCKLWLGIALVTLSSAILSVQDMSSFSFSAGSLLVLLGFVAYGLSIVFYIYAQRELGAAKTSAYDAIAPFIGVGLSLVIFREIPTPAFLVALVVMVAGTWVVTVADTPA